MDWNQDCDIIIKIRNGAIYLPSVPVWFDGDDMVPSTSSDNAPYQIVMPSEWDIIAELIDDIFSKGDEESIGELNRDIYQKWQDDFMRLNEYLMRGSTSKPRTTLKHRPGYVYIIKAGSYYKIGRTKNVDRRIMQLSTQPPFDLELIHVISTTDMPTKENELHGIFSDKHKNGEWFELTEEDVTWLKTL